MGVRERRNRALPVPVRQALAEFVSKASAIGGSALRSAVRVAVPLRFPPLLPGTSSCGCRHATAQSASHRSTPRSVLEPKTPV